MSGLRSPHGDDLDEVVAAELDEPQPLPPSLSAEIAGRDRFARGMTFMVGLVVAGFVLIALGKRSIAANGNVSHQLPALISGCLVGVTLIAAGAGLAVTLHSRRVEAALRQETDDAVAAAVRLVMTYGKKHAR